MGDFEGNLILEVCFAPSRTQLTYCTANGTGCLTGCETATFPSNTKLL